MSLFVLHGSVSTHVPSTFTPSGKTTGNRNENWKEDQQTQSVDMDQRWTRHTRVWRKVEGMDTNHSKFWRMPQKLKRNSRYRLVCYFKAQTLPPCRRRAWFKTTIIHSPPCGFWWTHIYVDIRTTEPSGGAPWFLCVVAWENAPELLLVLSLPGFVCLPVFCPSRLIFQIPTRFE